MRTAFADALTAAARRDPRLLVLTGDHGYALFDALRRECPDQYINAGVAEQNLVGVAAGLAKAGFRPVVYGLSAFVPVRVLEQIKIDVCYEGLPVLFVGDGAGVVYGTLGVTHQSTEDIAALRALPNLSILSPADGPEMAAALELALATDSPVYLRIGKAELGQVHARPPALSWGRMLPVRRGPGPLVWLATGSMVVTAVAAAVDWPGSAVWSVPSIKPLDAQHVAAICRRRVAVVLEEHSVYGGLGSAVAEATAAHAPVPVCRVGINDRFSASCGSYGHLLREHGLDLASVRSRVRAFVDALPGRVRTRNRKALERTGD